MNDEKRKIVEVFLQNCRLGLSPFQKELLMRTLNGERFYACFPRNTGRIYIERILQK